MKRLRLQKTYGHQLMSISSKRGRQELAMIADQQRRSKPCSMLVGTIATQTPLEDLTLPGTRCFNQHVVSVAYLFLQRAGCVRRLAQHASMAIEGAWRHASSSANAYSHHQHACIRLWTYSALATSCHCAVPPVRQVSCPCAFWSSWACFCILLRKLMRFWMCMFVQMMGLDGPHSVKSM